MHNDCTGDSVVNSRDDQDRRLYAATIIGPDSTTGDHLYDIAIREQYARDSMLKPLPLLSVQIKRYVWHRRLSPSAPGKISSRLSAGRGIVKAIELICPQTSVDLRPMIRVILTLNNILRQSSSKETIKKRHYRTAMFDDVIIAKGHRFKIPSIFNVKSCDTECNYSSNILVLHRIFIDAIYH